MSCRYDTADSNGETRRQRNKRFGQDELTPSFDRPIDGKYIIEWFFNASNIRRYQDGKPQLLSSTEWIAWAEITGNSVSVEEWAVLRDMDSAYVSEAYKEIAEDIQRNQKKKK